MAEESTAMVDATVPPADESDSGPQKPDSQMSAED
jgi:hypothetical protein